jgi:PhzF family phenazine biosynthesis protein
VNAVWTTVFPDGLGGGNPCPVAFDADALSDEEMQAAAAEFGFETAFVLRARGGTDARLRFFVPAREMATRCLRRRRGWRRRSPCARWRGTARGPRC